MQRQRPALLKPGKLAPQSAWPGHSFHWHAEVHAQGRLTQAAALLERAATIQETWWASREDLVPLPARRGVSLVRMAVLREHAAVLRALGKATAASAETGTAETLFQRVLDREQTSILAESAHFQLAQIYRKQGRLPDADREMKLFQEMRKNRK